MSRLEARNERYTFAFGVDHTPMGCFVQIWDKRIPLDEFDTPHLNADEMYGLRIQNDEVLKQNVQLAYAWADLADSRGLCNEEKIIAVGLALGFDRATLEQQVFELWD